MGRPTSVPLHIDRPPGSSPCGYRPMLTEPTEPDPRSLTGPGQRVNPTQRCPEGKKRREGKKEEAFKRLVRKT